jgi:hypothetical protein
VRVRAGVVHRPRQPARERAQLEQPVQLPGSEAPTSLGQPAHPRRLVVLPDQRPRTAGRRPGERVVEVRKVTVAVASVQLEQPRAAEHRPGCARAPLHRPEAAHAQVAGDHRLGGAPGDQVHHAPEGSGAVARARDQSILRLLHRRERNQAQVGDATEPVRGNSVEQHQHAGARGAAEDDLLALAGDPRSAGAPRPAPLPRARPRWRPLPGASPSTTVVRPVRVTHHRGLGRRRRGRPAFTSTGAAAPPPPGIAPRRSTPRSTPARDTPEPTAIRPSSAFHSLPRREKAIRRRRVFRCRALGQVSWLTAGERGRRPDGAFHVLVRPPTFPRNVQSAVATDGGCRTGRFLGPLPFTVAGPRRTLTGFPVGPDMGTRGQAVCGTAGRRGASRCWAVARFLR